MADTIYNRGIPQWGAQFEAGVIKALLLKGAGYVVNPDHDFVADLAPGDNEAEGAGYARETLTGKVQTIDDAANVVTYDADDPDFGPIVAGENITGMVVYREVTNDADSILLAYYELAATATNGTAFVVTLHADGLARFAQAA